MNTLEIIRTLHQHRKLAQKRAAGHENQTKAKIIGYVVLAIMAIYLLFLAVMFALIMNDSPGISPSATFLSLAPFLVVVDICFRFMAQQTPAQLVKPYITLPMSKYTCVHYFLFQTLFSWSNSLWHILLIPFALMSIVFREGLLTAILFLLAYQVYFLISSQVYIIIRTFLKDSLLWIVLPIAIVALIALPGLYPTPNFEHFMFFYQEVGEALCYPSATAWLLLIGLLLLVLLINRQVQFAHVIGEVSRSSATKLRHVSNYSFLDRFGDIGEYLKLEIKLISRNKHPRTQYLTMLALCIVMWAIYGLGWSDMDEAMGTLGSYFWCMYLFIVLGVINLQRIMNYEGNYIDCLMVHRENILSLLTAKYYFYSAMMIVPLILSIISYIQGAWSMSMILANLFYVMGPIYCMAFQLAIYNKETIPLDANFTSRTHNDTNWVQIIIYLATLGVPILFVWIISSLMSAEVANYIIIAISLPFIFTHPLWLRNIYHRMMKRRYINMEGFRSTR